MNETEDRGGRGVSQDARIRFAELLRRTERNGERIRLTRRGMPIAYIVPLVDGEKLQHYETMRQRQSDGDDGARSFPEMPPMPEFPDLPQLGTDPDDHESMYSHGDESERDRAISAFKKGVMRILTDTHELKRPDIRDRFADDNYIGTAVRKVIGTGGGR